MRFLVQSVSPTSYSIPAIDNNIKERSNSKIFIKRQSFRIFRKEYSCRKEKTGLLFSSGSPTGVPDSDMPTNSHSLPDLDLDCDCFMVSIWIHILDLQQDKERFVD